MHARVTTSQARSEALEEAIRIVQESILPAARQQPGFRGLLHLADRGSGKGLTVSLWETEAAMRASEESGYYREQLDKVLTLLVAQPLPAAYEVVIHEA